MKNSHVNLMPMSGLLLVVGILLQLYPEFFSHFSTHIPAGFADGVEFRGPFYGGDHLQLAYLGWKLKQAIVTSQFPIYVDGYNFALNGEPFIDMHIGVQFVAQAIANLFVDVAVAYNSVMILGALVATYLSSHFMASQITTSAVLRVGAGLGLALLPYRMSQSAIGHGGGAVFALIPLYIGAIIRHRRMRSDFRWDAVAGLVLFLTVLSDEHQGYYLLLASGMLFLSFWAADAWHARDMWSSALKLLSHWRWLLCFLALVIVFGLGIDHLLGRESDGASLVRSYDEIGSYSRSLSFFLKRGGNIGSVWFSSLLLSLLVGLVYRWSWQQNALRIWIFALPTTVFAILMMGVGSHWSQQFGLYQWFCKYVPFFAYQRVPTKMSVIVAVLLVVCSLIAIERIRPSQRSLALNGDKFLRLACTFIVVLFCSQPFVFWEYAHTHRKSLILDDVSSGYPTLSAHMREHLRLTDKVFILPASDRMDRFSGLAQLLAMHTETRFINGYHGAAPMKVMEGLLHMSSFSDVAPSASAIRWLRDEAVSHFIVSDDPGPELHQSDFKQKLENTGLVEMLHCEQGLCLYKIVTQKLIPENYLTLGRSGPQTYREVPGRWMIQDDVAPPQGVEASAVNEFLVKTLVNVEDEKCKSECEVEVQFGGGRDEQIWLIQAGSEQKQQIQLLPPHEGDQNNVLPARFVIKGKQFMLAVKQGWRPSDMGIHVAGRYGYFFTEPKVLASTSP